MIVVLRPYLSYKNIIYYHLFRVYLKKQKVIMVNKNSNLSLRKTDLYTRICKIKSRADGKFVSEYTSDVGCGKFLFIVYVSL